MERLEVLELVGDVVAGPEAWRHNGLDGIWRISGTQRSSVR